MHFGRESWIILSRGVWNKEEMVHLFGGGGRILHRAERWRNVGSELDIS